MRIDHTSLEAQDAANDETGEAKKKGKRRKNRDEETSEISRRARSRGGLNNPIRTFFIKLQRLILSARRRAVKRGKKSWQPFPQEDASPRIVYDLSTFVFLLLYPSGGLAARERFQGIRESIELSELLAKWIEIVDLAG